MWSRLLMLALAQHPLASDDAQVRLDAVTAWARKKKPQFPVKVARTVTDCVELAAVPETGCPTKAKLCRLHEGDDGSSGTRIESLSFLLEGHEKPLRVWWTAAYEPPLTDCDPPEKLEGHDSPEQHATEVATWRKSHAKEYAQCQARLQKDATNDAEELSCDVVLINACRAEAYATCKSKNLRKGMTALTRLHRFEF
jgi:hypothetical protein